MVECNISVPIDIMSKLGLVDTDLIRILSYECIVCDNDGCDQGDKIIEIATMEIK